MSADTCIETHYGERDQPLPATPAPYFYIEFDGDSSFIDCGSDPSLAGLVSAPFTMDAWVRLYDRLPQHEPIAAMQDFGGGWEWGKDFMGRCASQITYSVSAANSVTIETPTPGDWLHLVFCLNWGIDDKIYHAIDGSWCTYVAQDAGIGIAQNATAQTFQIGADPFAVLFGQLDVQWFRVSSGIRFPIGVDFTPPVMCGPPVVDGTTIELWAMDEGTGAVTAASVVPANDGAMTDCTWHECV